MSFKSIVKENVDFNTWKQEMEDAIAERKKAIRELNNQLDIDEFRALGYDEAKEVYGVLTYNLDYKEVRPKYEAVLEELRKEKFPELNKAYYYPVLNELDWLSAAQKRGVDDFLGHLRIHNYLHRHSNAWYQLVKLGIDEDKVLNFLLDQGIVGLEYKINCGCGEGGEIITVEAYEKHKTYFDICKNRETITEEDVAWLDEFEESGERQWQIGCFECEGKDVESMEDLEVIEKIYKLLVTVDPKYKEYR